MEPPAQLEGTYTTAPINNHDCGSPEEKGHIAEGSAKGRPKKDPRNSKPISRTDPLPDAALQQPTTLPDLKERSLLPGLGAQDLYGPTLQSLALVWASPADTPMAPPIDTQQTQTQQVPSHSTAEPQPDLETVQECGFTPHFTSDTHILILEFGTARWSPIRQARRGCTVLQTLPSSNIGDLKGAHTAILEHVLFFKGGREDADMIRMGMACIAANHPIRTDVGWTLASQAAPQDHGQLPDREFSQLCCLKLHFGGNVLIKTSAPQDQVPTFIEAATMGYCFLPPSEPHNGSSPTYNLKQTGPRDEFINSIRLSYSQVTTLYHRGISMRPILCPTPLNPSRAHHPRT